MSHGFPSYRLHRPSGRAVVTLNGRDYYLGTHGTEASRREYDSLVARWIEGGRGPLRDASEARTVDEVILAYWRHADGYYRKGGRKTGHWYAARAAIRGVGRMFGTTPADDFRPTKLVAVREGWLKAGMARDSINQYVAVVKRAWAWAAERELVGGGTAMGLRAVRGLRAGRTEAPDREPIRPVPVEDVDAVLAVIGPRWAAMIRLQLATGMRPGEVCRVRAAYVDRSGTTWVYVPGSHKTEHHGRRREIAIGPAGRAILGPWLDAAGVARYAFAAAEVSKPVDPVCYEKAVGRACRRAGVAKWSPNRLRHNYATMIRSALGLDAAQVMLGHASANVTQVYAEADRGRMAEIAERTG